MAKRRRPGFWSRPTAMSATSSCLGAARQENPELVRKFVKRFESNPLDPYDLDRDPRGKTLWYKAGLQLATQARDIDRPSSLR